MRNPKFGDDEKIVQEYTDINTTESETMTMRKMFLWLRKY